MPYPNISFLTASAVGPSITFIDDKPAEKSTLAIPFYYFDCSGTAVTPTSVVWSLTDKDGNIINSREDVSIGAPANSNEIVLSGDDLELTDTDNATRILLVQAVFTDPTYGAGLPLKGQCSFEIENIIALE